MSQEKAGREDIASTPEQEAVYQKLKWQLSGRTTVQEDGTKRTKLYRDTAPYIPQDQAIKTEE